MSYNNDFFPPIKSRFGDGKSFPGHAGIPGHVGGSAPRRGGAIGGGTTSDIIGGSAADYVRSGMRTQGAPKKLPVGTELQLKDKRILSVDRSNGYQISGIIKGTHNFSSIDLRNEDAVIKYIPPQQTTMKL